MIVGVIPRDPNPYQEDLYRHLRPAGFRTVYLAEWTGSQTLNLLLLPVELLVRRVGGMRVVHLHWVFGFAFPWLAERPGKKLARWWFNLVLAVCSLLGLRVVWTAHNLLPHSPVFDDDVVGRKTLLRHAAAVIAHSEGTVLELERLGARHVDVIPAGVDLPPLADGPGSRAARARLDLPEGFVALYFGVIKEYKGVEDLIEAARAREDLQFVVVGGGSDVEYRAGLQQALAQVPGAIDRMGHVPDEILASYLAAADVVVLPFREVTNSSSALHALAAGAPLVIPRLPSLADIPDSCVVRYDGGAAGLASVLGALIDAGPTERADLAARGRAWASTRSWDETAARTAAVLRRVVSGS